MRRLLSLIVGAVLLTAGCASTARPGGQAQEHAAIVASEPSVPSLVELSLVPRSPSDLLESMFRRLGCHGVAPLKETIEVCIDNPDDSQQVTIETGMTKSQVLQMQHNPRGTFAFGIAPPNDYWAASCYACPPSALKPLGGHVVVD